MLIPSLLDIQCYFLIQFLIDSQWLDLDVVYLLATRCPPWLIVQTDDAPLWLVRVGAICLWLVSVDSEFIHHVSGC